MFDDLTPKNAPAGQPGNFAPKPPVASSVEDMFSASESEKPASFQPKPTSNFQDVAPVLPSRGGNVVTKILVFSLIIVGIGLIGGGAYYAYVKFYKKVAVTPTPVDETAKQSETPTTDTAEQAEQVNNENPQNIATQGSSGDMDTDQDGLTDKEEEVLGTNKTETDSDFDGLFDREEVKVYGTNPLKPDTEGDGVKDGDEVASKTNPRGEGVLYGSDGSVSSSTASTSSTASASSTNSGQGATSSVIEQTSSSTTTAAEQTKEVDTDNDDLTDAEEINTYKTDPNKADTDGDGLSDSEEVNKYKTNPLTVDTDGDGYTDGAEVKGGYNPNGAGKLVK